MSTEKTGTQNNQQDLGNETFQLTFKLHKEQLVSIQ